MQNPTQTIPQDRAALAFAVAIPVTTLSPCEMVTDAMLRDLAEMDPLRIADGEDKVMLAGLSMTLADICGELLARRHVMEKGLA